MFKKEIGQLGSTARFDFSENTHFDPLVNPPIWMWIC